MSYFANSTYKQTHYEALYKTHRQDKYVILILS